MITVFESGDPAETQLVRSRLEVAGFDAVIPNELSTMNIEHGTIASGGSSVQVPQDQAEEARALIKAEENMTS
ncbi:MAG: hypothetical protein JWM68_3048 [Verrucomicrobiales bacterium]|nr:hypothetical protein [Verrucomicrobiales bacterium]